MLWLRGALFTLLVPALLAFFVPQQIIGSKPLQSDGWRAGWLLVLLGSAIYTVSLFSFLAARGTPAIFFTRHLRFVLGEEPASLVRGQLYRFTRNPMYLAVVTAIFGQAVLFADVRVAFYGAAAFVFFHLIVVLVEEPHLRRREGEAFDRYCRAVPRWLRLR